MQNHLKDKKKNCILRLLIVINNHFVQILPFTQLNTWFIELIQCNKINIHDKIWRKTGIKVCYGIDILSGHVIFET